MSCDHDSEIYRLESRVDELRQDVRQLETIVDDIKGILSEIADKVKLEKCPLHHYRSRPCTWCGHVEKW